MTIQVTQNRIHNLSSYQLGYNKKKNTAKGLIFSNKKCGSLMKTSWRSSSTDLIGMQTSNVPLTYCSGSHICSGIQFQEDMKLLSRNYFSIFVLPDVTQNCNHEHIRGLRERNKTQRYVMDVKAEHNVSWRKTLSKATDGLNKIKTMKCTGLAIGK